MKAKEQAGGHVKFAVVAAVAAMASVSLQAGVLPAAVDGTITVSGSVVVSLLFLPESEIAAILAESAAD